MTVCFLLGTTFTHWIADHNVLWRFPLTSEAILESITYYSLLSAAPPWMGWVYVGVGASALLSSGGRGVKGWRGMNGEMLFDGGSVVLLAAITYTQIFDVFPTISLLPSPLPPNVQDHPTYPALATAVRDLALDNVMTAVMLTGVMLLQAGRYYAKRPSSSPVSLMASANITPPPDVLTPPQSKPPSPLTERSATPFRELTRQVGMELRDPTVSSPNRRRHRKR
ncbi:hypothetical protein M231_07041 [Tremella mesenterica]|uniref:DUF4149 domain-containing protein n=2 Tax=Tremella mesenterica TaxID=5217 RepID=A0A4Q1BA64_TREME|nr:hypothetical protein M231_07041 [Tremella mesenterica]